jgi:N-methylhydantoinase B/oxoprolinase/acetone carboxylase alpha subunit
MPVEVGEGRYPLEKGDLIRLKTDTGGEYGSALDRDP